MAIYIKDQGRWVYVVEARCYAIAYYKKDSWHCYIPMCYASREIIEKLQAMSEIDPDTMFITLVIQTDEMDYLKVIIGSPVFAEIHEPQAWQMSYDHIEEAQPGRIIINGQTVYGLTPFGMLWTPVRPDMGAVDIYERDWGKIHNAIGKNLGIDTDFMTAR